MSGAKDWAKLNIATLKLELADRNLDVTGKKVDLVTRLEQYECASKQNLASGDGPGLSEDSKHHDSHDTTGEVFSVDDLQLVDEFIDEDYLEEEEKMEGLDKENRDDGKPEQLKTYDVATLYIPKVNEMHKDLQVAQKFRVLYIYPLRTEMMADPAVQIHFLRCSSVLCKFYPTETPDGYISEGYVILRFEFSEDALTAMEELTNILPANVHIKVRQLGQTHMDVLSGIIRTEPKGVEIWLKDNKNTKIVFVGNLPPTATEAALKEIFTGATIIRIAREDDSSSKGYAIVGYDNSKDAEQAAEEHSSAVLDSYVLAVFHFPATPKRHAAEKEQMERLKKTEKDEKQESVKSEEPVKKESVTPQMKKGVTPLKKSGVTPQKQENTESKITPVQIKRESSTPQRNATPGLKKPVTPQEGVPKKDSVTPKVKKESPTPQAKKNGQDTKKTGAKPTGKVNNKSPAAASQKTGGVRTAEKHQAVGAGRQGPRQTQRLAQKRPRARGGNKPGFPQQQRRVGGKWEQTNDNKGMRGNQTQLLRSPYQRMQKKQGLWEQALERRQEQRTGGGMQRQSTWRSQQFANGNKRQLPYNSGGVDDKRRRMEQTPYGSRQSSYEPRAPSLLDMSITKRMAQQMSPNSGFLHGGAGLGQGGGMGGGMGMGQGVGMVQGGGFEQGGGMGMGGGMMEQGGGMVQDRGMMMQDRGMVQDRGMMLQDRGMMLQDQGMMVQDRGVVQDRGMMVQERGMAQDRGMVQGGGIYPGSSMQQGQMGYGGGNQARMQSDIMGAGGGMGPGEMGQGSGGPGQGSGVAPSSGTVNLLLGLTQILSNQLPPQSRQMMRQSRGQSRGGQSYSRGGNRGGSTNRGGGTRRFRGFNGSRR